MSFTREFSTPSPVKSKQPKIQAEVADLTAETIELALRVEQFDYAELRAIAVYRDNKNEEEKEVFYRASEGAINELIDMFSNANLLNRVKTTSYSVLGQEAILALANTLLSLKTHVQTTEDHYFERNQHNRTRVELRNDSTWIVHFHYVIEQYLDTLPHISKYQYGACIKNIQKLSEETYCWISKYKPELTNHYAALQPQGFVARNGYSKLNARRQLFAKNSPRIDAQKRNQHTAMLDDAASKSTPAANPPLCFKRIKF